ncbi:VacJ family lipoprotein [Halieaceae bacterium IMCC14734]|uniref:VacJ family lipoprotein n=1 Tax=Candidatus Litorirhabdus singularis TaxID=2518993 RepID=A0ABT3TIB8_9GAMM|nr:VacJ family lipoprotein [Candidatus Litorirhabdus singularis]MCX2982077.1 VacJ family lipoprotein [Candidatus Litorirhabdus singularis]
MKFVLRLISLSLVLATSACATAAETAPGDPYEAFNRKVFAFNDALDRNIIAPLSLGYRAITPNFAERGVRNFFSNLYDFNGTLNAIVQGRFPEAGRDGGRFVINSTVGMFGLVDVASEMGIAPYRTDFGHTLALWGMDSGPYIMVPFFGPRTVRSGTGFMVDTVASVQWSIDSFGVRAGLFSLEVIDNRAALTDAEQLISGDRYIFIRDIYLQTREAFVNDGVVQDTFSDFEDEFGDEFDWDEE